MMSLRLTPLLSLLVLLMISGVAVSQDWDVYYTPKSICALKGSTVTMGCRYTYPTSYTVERAIWSRELVTDKEPLDLTSDPKYRGRVQYLGDKQRDCSLRLSDVTEQDRGKYYFRFITKFAGGKYQGQDGVDLSVTELEVEIPDRVFEGDTVTLTCKTRNRLSGTPPFIWYRSGRRLSSSTNLLRLPSVSQRDVGRYSCAVQDLQSCDVTLDVQYPPKSVSVSISPSGDIVEGSSVTLTCSSDAKPPAHDYTWYKGTSLIGTGKTYTINKISSEDSGEYKCKAGNIHGLQSSTAASLNVLYPPKSISVSIRPSGEIVEGSSVTLTCSSDANPVEYNWFKGTSPKSRGKTYTIRKISSEDSGAYKCKSSNQYGEKYSDEVTINVLYPPKRVSVSISPSGEIVEGSSVTLTCSSDANPPVQTYTWYKGTTSIGTGRSYSINTISSEDSGEYKCKARNRHGEKYSNGATLNVLYPPKRVSVSISRSGEIVEGSAVTLTCSSDANPPVQNYTWYKVDESSPLGSGQSYSFILRFNTSGWFYCMAQNKYGNQTAAAVALTLNGGLSVVLYVVLGVTAGCACLFAIIGVLCMRRKRRGGSADDTKSSQNIYCSPTEDTYTALDLQTRSSKDVYDTLTVHPSPSDDPYTAMDSQSISPDYETLTTARKQQ